MRSATKKRAGKDRAYLEWLHTLSCAAASCYSELTSPCSGRITAHHAGDHGFSQKADDRTAIPLCEAHHQTGPDALHVLGKRFWKLHGLDRDELIADLNARYLKEAA
jgi:hypothetical protein